MSSFRWFLSGVGLGAIAGVLYAPQTGSETRSELLSQAGVAKEKGTALVKQTVEAAGDYTRRGKESAGQYLEQGTALANDHLAKASSALVAAKEAYAQSTSQTLPAESALNLQSSSSEASS